MKKSLARIAGGRETKRPGVRLVALGVLLGLMSAVDFAGGNRVVQAEEPASARNLPGAAARAAEYPPVPATPRQLVTDAYHGRQVVDEYRWLESGDDPEVRRWSDAQSAATRTYLDGLPARPAILRRLEEVTSTVSPRYYALEYRAGVYFALKEQPPLQQPVLVRFDAPEDLAGERVVVDPNSLDPTGGTTIDFYEPSLDGRLIAVSLSQGGSESGSVSVFDAGTGERLPDLIPRVNGGTAGGSVSWAADGLGFLRTRYPQPGERAEEDLGFYEQLYFHQLGTPVEEDRYVLGGEFPKIAEIFLDATEDGRYVVADVLNGDGGEHAFWLRGPGGEFREIARFEDGIVLARFGGEHLYLLEREAAPNGRILRVPLDSPALALAEMIVPESEAAIEDFETAETLLYVIQVDGGPSRVQMFDLTGRPRGLVPLPELVSVARVLPTEGDVALIRVAGYTSPPAWWRFDPGGAVQRAQAGGPGASGKPGGGAAASGRLEPTALAMRTAVDFSRVEVRREFAVSKDGTRIPISILYQKGVPRDGTAPALLTGYGGFSISQSPAFDERSIVWLEQGGVSAIANLRGGGEYGENWHRAGALTKKQNVFDDFAACARHLIDGGYTSAERLAIEGGSNGGLLMGAALTQHPELYRAVVSHAGLYDMLRNELTPNGSFNTTEYGSVKDPAQFEALYAYSPYHRVVDGGMYPAVLFLSGANDPRVDPYHSRKMTARLQAASRSGRPILLRTSASTGHGFGTPFAEENEQAADVYAFLFAQLGVEYREVGQGR